MKLSEIAKEIQGAKLHGSDAEILSLCADSRVAGEDDLFFCLQGARVDSHELAFEAEMRGAAAVICEHEVEVSIPQMIVPDARRAMAYVAAAFYCHPERKMKFVGITGTNGKTTVSHMIYEILKADGREAGLIGTLGAKYGAVEIDPSLTTPDPIALFSLLADMKRKGVDYVVMEVSAHALELGKVDPILFDLAVFTNLSQDHLDFFGDMKRYGGAKRKLFTREHCREAVLNADDEFCRSLEGDVPSVCYGLDSPADCFAIVERESLSKSEILLNLEDDLVEVFLPMTGRHNVYNALAAGVVAKQLGVSGESISEGLAHIRVEGRLQKAGEKNGASVFIDFAHTPDGIEQSLTALRPFCKNRLIILFGCGGNRDRSKRPLMGEKAAKFADFAVITSDNPRYEDPVDIITEIEVGYKKFSKKYVAVEEREKAIEYACNMLKPGDILLIAGKGGEKEQEIMGIKYSYNDKTIVESLLEKS